MSRRPSLLSSIFRLAMREQVAIANPCDEMPKSVRGKIPARRKRNRRLSSEEEKALFGVGLVGRREHRRPVSEGALCAGIHTGVLLRLQGSAMNFSGTTVTSVVDDEVEKERSDL